MADDQTVSSPPVMVVPEISIDMGHVAEPAPQPAQAPTVPKPPAEPAPQPDPQSLVALPRQVVGPMHLPVTNLSTQIDSCVLSNPPWGACGLSFTQFVNTNSLRNMMVMGVSLFLEISIPDYFAKPRIKTGAIWFDVTANTILGSSSVVTLIVCTFLDNTLESNDRHNRGLAWTIQFHGRSRQFYDFPRFLRRQR